MGRDIYKEKDTKYWREITLQDLFPDLWSWALCFRAVRGLVLRLSAKGAGQGSAFSDRRHGPWFSWHSSCPLSAHETVPFPAFLKIAASNPQDSFGKGIVRRGVQIIPCAEVIQILDRQLAGNLEIQTLAPRIHERRCVFSWPCAFRHAFRRDCSDEIPIPVKEIRHDMPVLMQREPEREPAPGGQFRQALSSVRLLFAPLFFSYWTWLFLSRSFDAIPYANSRAKTGRIPEIA